MNTAVATITDAPRRSLIAEMANRYGMEARAFAETLRATVVPPKATNEEFAAFLMVAREYNLNPITKEIYAFPKQGGGIQPIVSVDGWSRMVNDHPQCDGFEFEDHVTDKGDLVSVTCRMFRKDRTHPTSATEYMAECRRDTSTWKQWPRRMLRHKALIQAARYAFGFSGIVDPDEAQRFTQPAARGGDAPPPPPPKAAPPKLVAPPPPPPHDADTGEIVDDLDIPPALDRRKPAQAASAAPSPEDPEAMLDWIDKKLSEVNDPDQLASTWNDIIEPRLDGAFPPDLTEAQHIYTRHERRLGID